MGETDHQAVGDQATQNSACILARIGHEGLRCIDRRAVIEPAGTEIDRYENDDEGKAAEKSLNGSDLGGRSISVAEARPKEDRPQRSW